MQNSLVGVFLHRVMVRIFLVRFVRHLLVIATLLLQSGLVLSEPLQTRIDGYEVTGNTLLTQQQIQQSLSGSTGALSLDDIQKAAQLLQQAYRNAGYGAVVVQVPQQTLQDHTVKLEVIEGRLSQIQVTGTHEFSKENILRSLPALELHATPLLSALDSELIMANQNPSKTAHVVFQPGENKGEVEALVVVQEQPVQQWSVVLDNTGNDATGLYRLSGVYQNANFLDSDSVLGVRLVTSPTQLSEVAIASATLRLPLYGAKMFWEWSALASNTKNSPNQTPAGELNFTGQGYSAGGRAIWILSSLSEFKQQASVGLDARKYDNTCKIGNLGAPGCGTAGASVDVAPLTIGYTLDKPGTANASVQAVLNLPVSGAGNDSDFNASRPGANSHYHLLRFNARNTLPLSADWTLASRLDLQLTGQALVSAEQFGAGGAYSVRGYPERILSADSGAFASIDMNRSLNDMLDMQSARQFVQGFWFVDAAKIANRLDTNCMAGKTSCSLWGTGVGLSWRTEQNTSASLAVARAGETVDTTRAGSWRVHFNLNYAF